MHGPSGADRQTLRIDRRGYRTTYVLDANDQLTGRRYPDGTRATFTFDSTGSRVTMRDSTGRYTYAYDARSQRSLAMTPASQRISYSYDALGQRSQMIAPIGGRFTYSYDAAGRITLVLNPEGDRTSYSYDNASRRTLKLLANGTRASFTYDNADRLTTLANIAHTNTYISRYDYKYDPAGNRTAVLEVDGSVVTWLYDNTYQLTGEHRTGTVPYRHTFTYDPLGNRLVKNEDGTRTTTTYDLANQIRYSVAAAGRTTYTFDAAGNQQLTLNPDLTRTTTTWDYENQPTLYELADASRVTMAYNADNQRIQKQSNTTTKFLWDEQNYLAEIDGADVTQVVYTHEPQQYGHLISQHRDSATNYFHFDALGSTRQATNDLATTTDTLIYSAWGEQMGRTGSTPISLAWIGQLGYYQDGNIGLFSARARIFCPALARWASTDPIGYYGGDNNLYRYVMNTPLQRSDPSGHVLFAFDGTGNDKGSLTNVWRFYLLYSGDKFWISGPGTQSNWYVSIPDAATAPSVYGRILTMLRSAQRYYCRSNAEKDVDIIGFSRGAASARAFANYVKPILDANGARIRFIGVWDTVPAMGISGGDGGLPLGLPPGVTQAMAYHAMSIDENRNRFALERYSGATEVWFAGGHSDVGGGYDDNQGYARITRGWMAYHAIARGVPLPMWFSKQGYSAAMEHFQKHDEMFSSILDGNPMWWINNRVKREMVAGDKVHVSAAHQFLHDYYRQPDFGLNDSAARKYLKMSFDSHYTGFVMDNSNMFLENFTFSPRDR